MHSNTRTSSQVENKLRPSIKHSTSCKSCQHYPTKPQCFDSPPPKGPPKPPPPPKNLLNISSGLISSSHIDPPPPPPRVPELGARPPNPEHGLCCGAPPPNLLSGSPPNLSNFVLF